MTKKIGFISLVVLTVLALAYGFLPKPIEVALVEVKREPFEWVVRESGETRLIESYRLAAPVSGRLQRINARVGDSVDAAQVVTEIQPNITPLLDARTRAAAEATLAAAKARSSAASAREMAARSDLEFSKAELARIEKLTQTGGASQDHLDRVRLEYQRSQAQWRISKYDVQVAEQDVKVAQSNLLTEGASHKNGVVSVPVTSPITGVILEIYEKNQIDIVAGQPLLLVGNPQLIEVEVEVLSYQAVALKPGLPVRIVNWGGDNDLQGVVQRLEPLAFTKVSALGVEEQRVKVVVDLLTPFEERANLFVGYRVLAEFLLWSSEDALVVPAASLFRAQGQWTVFVAQNSVAVSRAVTVKYNDGIRAVISDGLKSGEQVINHPDRELREGSAIRFESPA